MSSYRRRYKRRQGVGGVIALIVILMLIVGAVIAAAVGSSGFTNKDFKAWFNHWGKGEVVLDNASASPAAVRPAKDKIEESNVIVTKSESDSMLVSIVSLEDDSAEASYNLNVTVSEPFTNAAVGSRLVWDTSSELYDWAECKAVADYISITQSSNAGHEFRLSALQPFGCPAVLQIYLFMDNTVNCSVRLDFLKRANIEDLDLIFGDTELVFDRRREIPITYNFDGSVGTLEGEVQFGNFAVTLSDSLIADISNNLGEDFTPAYNFEGGEYADCINYFLSSPAACFANGAEDFDIAFCRAISSDTTVNVAFTAQYVYNGAVVVSDKIGGDNLSAALSVELIYDVVSDSIVKTITLADSEYFNFAVMGDNEYGLTEDVDFREYHAGEHGQVYLISRFKTGNCLSLFEGQGAKLFDSDGVTEKNPSNLRGRLGTGWIVRIGDEDIIIIVLGDLNGDGTINVTDKIEMNRHLESNPALTGYKFMAADMDRNGVVDESDKEALDAHFNKT